VEELNRLGEAVLDSPAPCVVSHHEVGRGLEVIGDEEGRLLMPIAPDDKLAEGAIVSSKSDGGFVDLGVGELPLGVRHMNACPRRQVGYVVEQSFSSAPQGDESHTLAVEFGELGIAGEARVEYEGGRDPAADPPPEGEELEHLVIGLIAMDVGVGVEHELGLCILGEERQHRLHGLAPGPGPMGLED